MNLFNQKILEQRIAQYSFPVGDKLQAIFKVIQGWQKALTDSDLSKTKETSIQGKFLNVFFEQILGYEDQTSGVEEWSLIAEPKTEVDGQKADGSIGFFTNEIKTTVGVIELKDASTILDKKQIGREKGYTPVEQGYLYATKFDRCKWIIISNFREIRLYHKHRTEEFVESFDVLKLHEELEFKKFYYLLSKDNLISKSANSVIDDLAEKSLEQEQDISKKFYSEYKAIRIDLFNHLIENNKEIEKVILLEKSQKILDRLIFILFCEDTANLLPSNILREAYDLGIKSRDRNDQKVWRELRNLFIDIDEGRNDVDPKINGYNGGLFKYDEILDNLNIKDSIWLDIIKLSDYDFETDLNVNILGHIFEQSISDIELIKSDLAGVSNDKEQSKRKKDGIYYTPEYITKYIVENTVGRFLDENPDKLDNIKILDPACGSGAFLNQAHEFLALQHKLRHKEKTKELSGTRQLSIYQSDYSNPDSSILINNLHGVDLNEESVEITKLSLWLKTARRDKPLQKLDENIRVGNSVIADSQFASEKAFNWHQQFSSIMQNGGFDVIIGNPPYVRSEILKPYSKYFSQNYKTFQGKNDLYVYFFEMSLSLLRDGGYMAFIVSSKFTKTNYAEKLRQFILDNSQIVELVDFNDLQIFEGITAYPAIIILKKTDVRGNEILFKDVKVLPKSDFDIKNNSSILIRQSDLNESEWLLSGMEIKRSIELNKSLDDYQDILQVPKVGIKTGYNQAFLISDDEYQTLDSKHKLYFQKYIIGRDISSYLVNFSNWIFFPYERVDGSLTLIDEKELSECLRIIEPHKENLSKRAIIIDGLLSGKKKWYEYQQLNKNFDLTKKYIVYPNISNTSSFAVTNGALIDMTAFYIPVNKDEHLAYVPLLNSELINAYHKSLSIERRGGYRENKTQYLTKTKLPKLNKKQIELFLDFYKKQIQLHIDYNTFLQVYLEVLKNEFQIKDINLYTDIFSDEMYSELVSSQIKMSIDKKEELFKWLLKKKKEALVIKSEKDSIESHINEEVYSIYALNKDQISFIKGYI